MSTVVRALDPGVLAAGFVFACSLLAIALMAYFALRPEDRRPRCPRCDQTLSKGRSRCPRCGLEVDRSDKIAT